MKKNKICGVYRIVNIKNGKCYYGSSININLRWKVHLRYLRKGNHGNVYLQRIFNKYGEKNIRFEIVKLCKPPQLLSLEQLYIDKNKNGYNIGKKSSGGDNITNNPNRDDIINRMTKTINDKVSKMSKSEIKKRFSYPLDKNPNWKGGISVFYCSCGNKKSRAAITCHDCRERSGNDNPFFGKSHSKKTKNIISKNNKGRLPVNTKPIEIDGVEYTSANEASKKLKISPLTIRWRVISKNKKFKNYKYVK